MNFPPGKPILLLIVIAIASGVGLLLFPATTSGPSDLVLWTFSDDQSRMYQSATAEFGRISGLHVSVDVISSQGLDTLLSSMFMSGNAAGVVPDATEIEIGSIGRYFRPPTDAVGFLPLNDFLQHGGYRRIHSLADPGQPGWNALLVSDPAIYGYSHGHWSAALATAAGWPDWIPGTGDRTIGSLTDPGQDGWRARLEPDRTIYHFDGKSWKPDPSRTVPDAWIDRLLPSRLAPWTKDGVIFGLPQDVHPVTITYRADLFEEAGVDLAAATTWPAFQDACLRFQQYWAEHGFPHRHAIELSHASSDDLEMMLLQRHENLIDAQDQPHLTDPLLLQTLLFYVQLVAGPRQIGANPSGGEGMYVADLAEGSVCAMITPDWKAQRLRAYGPVVGPGLAGNLRMMPMPRFNPTDSPTSTWGGTMIGIPRDSPRIASAWRLIEFLYLDPPSFPTASAGIVPPLPERWNEPQWHEPDPFFGGQKVGALYVGLAREIPHRYVTPTSTIAELELAFVLGQAVHQMEKRGPAGLGDDCQSMLQFADRDLRRRIAQGRFE
jgi:ABC-type glycerol-3-phosphate transport system substrate-binding protein